MQFDVLGQLRAPSMPDALITLPPKPRRVLTLMVLNIGHVTYVDDLIDEVWGGAPPASAATTLQTYIYKVRRLLGRAAGAGVDGDAELLGTRPRGYLLHGDQADVDMYRFVTRIGQARHRIAEHPARVEEILRPALQMWRGPAFGGVERGPRLEAQAERLDEMRMCAVELLLRSSISTGRHLEIIDELRSLVCLHPYNELLRGYLMFSLAAGGRRHDALRVYADLQSAMRDSLGLDPSAQLAKLHGELLVGSTMSLPFAETR